MRKLVNTSIIETMYDIPRQLNIKIRNKLFHFYCTTAFKEMLYTSSIKHIL